jgi:hypothetical protein
MVEIDHPRAAAFAASGPRPSDLPHTAGFGDQISLVRIARDEINERLQFGSVPDFPGLPAEQRRFPPR